MNKKIPEITVNIFGTDYSVKQLFNEESPEKFEDANGYTELYSNEIIIRTGFENDKETYNNVDNFKLKVLRHELFHAIFYECGCPWYCDDENLVEFMSINFEKILRIIRKAEDNFSLTNRNIDDAEATK